MDLDRTRPITNAFQDVRLVSLGKLALAAEFPERDGSGPYVVAQEGCDPQDLTVTPAEFLLGRKGAWLRTADFFRLPVDQRREEYFFPRAADVIQLLEQLPSQPVVTRPGGEPAEPAAADPADEVHLALRAARGG